MRNKFLFVGIIIVLIGGIGYHYHLVPPWVLILVFVFFIIGLINMVQKKHTILRNFPLIGYFRYFFEFISPEIQQYFIERHTDGRPFSRNHRTLVYQRAKNIQDTHPFGTQLELNKMDYEGLKHSIYAKVQYQKPPRILIGGKSCKEPYNASMLNVSAMSFGAISKNAIIALTQGAKKGEFYVNTGEGGLSDYHLKHGCDIVWQIGTGYFGCRTEDGRFNREEFRSKAHHVNVKMIELKLSQGAKPGHGGVLPAKKNTPEIAKIRGSKPYTTVISPPGHREFSDANGLLNFLQELRIISGFKPVGFKLCIGNEHEFEELCLEMKNTGILPDFITVDGAEGGTGAAPIEFSDSVGVPIEPGLIFVHNMLKKHGLRDQIRIIASGKVLTGSSILKMRALGADLCNSARGFMFSLGCIMALRCNTNHCPTGITTQDKMLMYGLNIKDKSERVYYYQENTLKAVMQLLAAAGIENMDQIDHRMFIRGSHFIEMEEKYFSKGIS